MTLLDPFFAVSMLNHPLIDHPTKRSINRSSNLPIKQCNQSNKLFLTNYKHTFTRRKLYAKDALDARYKVRTGLSLSHTQHHTTPPMRADPSRYNHVNCICSSFILFNDTSKCPNTTFCHRHLPLLPCYLLCIRSLRTPCGKPPKSVMCLICATAYDDVDAHPPRRREL